MSDIDRHLRNIQAEVEYTEKRERDKELYEVTIETEEGIIITSMDYTRNAIVIEGLESNPKGFIKKPYKGRKPGER